MLSHTFADHFGSHLHFPFFFFFFFFYSLYAYAGKAAEEPCSGTTIAQCVPTIICDICDICDMWGGLPFGPPLYESDDMDGGPA